MHKGSRSAWRMGIVVLVACGAGAVSGLAQAPGEPQMSAEQKAAMAAWTKAMTPGKEHQEMASRIGTWQGKVSMWEAPGAAPQISPGKSERTMGLGGRVMIDHWTGSMMGMPFEGLGMTGYDNASGKWWSTWSDNFSTGVMTGTGTCDTDHKKGCSFVSSSVDPMTGKAKTTRSTVSWPTADDEVMEMFDTAPGGKEWKSMEIVLRRAKP
ncbi:MAG: DUF1579 family protein [Thermoanaerobaculia bacterium]|nr:DUF1579 family protein [Thermoanaerobaculia bacterium]